MSYDVCWTVRNSESKNYTYNISEMLGEAGFNINDFTGMLPEAAKIRAREVAAILEADPERFKKFNPENGWGSYDTIIPWLRDLADQMDEAEPTVPLSVH